MRNGNKIMMRTVSLLLCLVLITSCIISGTLARYTTQQTATSKIGFEKFGVNVTTFVDETELNKVGATIEYPSNRTAMEKAGVYSVTIKDLPIYPGVGEIDNTGIYKHLVRFNFSGTANVPVQVGISTDIDLNGFNTTITTGADTSVTYFPLGFSCFAYDYNGTTYTQLGEEYALGSSGVTTNADVVSRENNIAKNFQKNFDFTQDGNLAYKEFGTNANNKEILFYADTDTSKSAPIDTFDLGLFWTYSDTTTKNKYDTWLGQNNEGAAISVTFTVRVEQIDK